MCLCSVAVVLAELAPMLMQLVVVAVLAEWFKQPFI